MTAAVDSLPARRTGRERRAGGWGWLVGFVGEVLLTFGVLVLLFVAWQLWWTDVEANRDAARATTSLEQAFAVAPDGSAPAPGPGAPTSVPDAKAPGGLVVGKGFALMRIPRFGSDWVRPIYEGTGTDTLKRGLGHYLGTAAPGAVGNFAVAGHRTTWGRPLHDIERLVPGDRIVVESLTAYDVYAVTSHEIVRPTQSEVIAPNPTDPSAAPTKAMLTLTACHPKYSAAQRYIIHAELVGTYSRAEGLPVDVLAAPSWRG